MWMRRRLIFIAPLALAGLVLFVFLGGEIVRWLWNWLLPSLFGIREITFWQALGLLALCRILFGGVGMRGSSRGGARRKIRERMEERWAQATPEERERMRRRWGVGPPTGAGNGPDSATML